VSFKKSAADFEEGQEVTGKVMKIMNFGVFVDIGASTEALAPARLLVKEPNEYEVGEVLEQLTISQLDTASNKISVEQAGSSGASSGKLRMSDLKVGDKVEGIVKVAKDYGVFMDIGLARRDALLPASLFGESKMEDFKPDSKLEVYISGIDPNKDRVTLSVEEPTLKGPSIMSMGSGSMPAGHMLPDPVVFRYNAVVWGIDEEYIHDEPYDIYAFEKRMPEMVNISPVHNESIYHDWTYGSFQGKDQMADAEYMYMPVPIQLRKPDAEPLPEKMPDTHYSDLSTSWDVGVKHHIHTKYRKAPMNNPNWTFRAPSAVDFARVEQAKMREARAAAGLDLAEASRDEQASRDEEAES
jgi:predicted RNA-binding protein with RPS1 domain